MLRRKFIKSSIATATGLIMFPHLAGAEVTDNKEILSELEKNFIIPPAGARPWCFWMWMNGNITKQGITLDLEAMQRMGIGGVINFNSAVGIPRGPIDYAGEEWMEATAHAVKEADRLGIKMTIHNSPGYSGAGGPWVTPEMSMKQLVWTETFVNSSTGININLKRPYAKFDYYRDAFVIAYPSLLVEKFLMKDKLERVFLNDKEVDKNIITDGNLDTKIRVTSAGDTTPTAGAATQEGILTLVFSEPFESRAIAIFRKPEIPRDLFDGPRDHPPLIKLERSDDGVQYSLIGVIRSPELRSMDTPSALSFKPVKAKYYRLVSSSPTWITQVELYNGPRLGGWPGKTSHTHGDSNGETPIVDDDLIIDPLKIIDISKNMDGSGNLILSAPTNANWIILRIGYTSTGEEPAAHPDAGKGLEIDKFRKEALDFHFENFLDKFLNRIKPFIGKSFTGITTDSYEAGKQNWTSDFPAAFKNSRAYDIVSWLPALTGRIVGSIDQTEKFLWDTRKVQAELMAENFYGHFATECHKRGMAFSAEPYGDGNFDSLEVGSHLDIPMSEFWTRYIYGGDVTSKQAASLAHVYGKPVVAAEAYTAMPATAKWTDYPYSLKAEGDYFFTMGVNRLVFHTFVHQPYTTGFPGMTMGPFGMHIDRNNTWTEMAYGWTDYLKRTQYLLQQGLFVADVCYFKGDSPESGIPNIYSWLPDGYKGDVIGADALHKRFKIQDGRISLPGGMTYKVCVMAPLNGLEMTTLKRIIELVNDGMILVVNNKPGKSFGHKYKDEELQKLVGELYGELDGKAITRKKYGKGIVIWGESLSSILTSFSLLPDFTYSSKNSDAAIHFVHKQTNDAHVYFVCNHKRVKEDIVASFRLKGLQPELWNSETGQISDVAIFDELSERINIPLSLNPAGSVFIVFRKKAQKKYHALVKGDQVLVSSKAFAAGDNKLYNSIQNNFSVTAWVKPDTFAHPGKSMLFHAPDGETLYGIGHASTGISAGQNGIRLYERTKGNAKEVLFVNQPLQGWTHLAVIYSDNKPAVFINGKFAAEGRPSSSIVHPGMGAKADENQYASYFEGNFTRPNLIRKSITKDEVEADFIKGLPNLEMPSGIDFISRQGKLMGLAWENGSYKIEGTGSIKSVLASQCKNVDIAGPWQVSFKAPNKTPADISLQSLASLHHHQDSDIRHFSGTAIYYKTINIAADIKAGNRLFLHLGRVEIIAEIKINGKKAGITWKEPYMIEITKQIVKGKNVIEIAVTNLWPNRLIGDENLPAENQYTKDNNITALPKWYIKNEPKAGNRVSFATWHTYEKNSPLLESGLIGPVTLITAQEILIP